MEMDESFLTLLTPEGEFLRAKKQDLAYSIGEEIYFFPIADGANRKWLLSIKNSFKLKSIWKPVAALIFFLSAVIPIYQSNQAYAYMSIDAESSIELGLNKKMQVVEINGFNEEAEKIIAGLKDWKKLDVSEITQILIAELKEEGMIAAEEPIIISTVKTKQLEATVETRLEENIEEIKQSVVDQNIKVNEYTTTKEELEKALASGVSVGKYHKRKIDSEQKHQLKEKSEEDRSERKQNQNVPSPQSNQQDSNQASEEREDDHNFKGKQNDNNKIVPMEQQEVNERTQREQWKEERQNQKEIQRQNQNQRQDQRQWENRVPHGQDNKNEQQQRGNDYQKNNQQWQSNDKNGNDKNKRE